MRSFLFILALAVWAILPAAAEPVIVDGINGVVSTRVVTYSEVEDYSRPAADALRRQYYGQPEIYQQKLKEALNDSLQQLIERMLILRSFDTEGYKLPDSVVDELVNDRIQKFGDRVTFIKTIQAQGLTVEQFRKQVRDQYIESALRNENVQREIFISPYQIQQYYLANQSEFHVEDQIKLRMIVLTKSGPDDTNTLRRIREIRSKITDGTPFAEMAQNYSQGSQQHQGGDWGWVDRSVLRKDLADVAFTLKAGQMSNPIETPDAVYLLKVEETRPAHVRPLNQVRNDIEQTLRTQEQARLEKQWIGELKRKTFIRYF